MGLVLSSIHCLIEKIMIKTKAQGYMRQLLCGGIKFIQVRETCIIDEIVQGEVEHIVYKFKGK